MTTSFQKVRTDPEKEEDSSSEIKVTARQKERSIKVCSITGKRGDVEFKSILRCFGRYLKEHMTKVTQGMQLDQMEYAQ